MGRNSTNRYLSITLTAEQQKMLEELHQGIRPTVPGLARTNIVAALIVAFHRIYEQIGASAYASMLQNGLSLHEPKVKLLRNSRASSPTPLARE